jgi:hypothetical protein
MAPARLQLDQNLAEQRLVEAAALAASSESQGIATVHGILTVLAMNPDVASGEQAVCGPALAKALPSLPGYSHLAVVGRDGTIVCAADPAALGRDSATGISGPIWSAGACSRSWSPCGAAYRSAA